MKKGLILVAAGAVLLWAVTRSKGGTVQAQVPAPNPVVWTTYSTGDITRTISTELNSSPAELEYAQQQVNYLNTIAPGWASAGFAAKMASIGLY